jgi:transcriptional regulator with XRE-family HTH domain
MSHEGMATGATRFLDRPKYVACSSRRARSLAFMMGESEQRERFAYALQRAMRERGVSTRKLAGHLGVDQRKVGGWLKQGKLPNLYESQALAAVLRVNEDLFRNPPEVPPPPPEPYYPIEQYLLEVAGQTPTAAGAEEGERRAAERLARRGPGTPARSPRRRARATGEG